MRRPGADLFLTFDDGPDPNITTPLLAVLAKHHARATFFLKSSRVRAYPELVVAIAAAGHELGVCGEATLNYNTAGAAEIALDMDAGRRAILELAPGAHVSLVRPTERSYSTSVGAAAKAAGLRPVRWTCDTDDADAKPGRSSVARILETVYTCMHPLLRADRHREAGGSGWAPGVVILAHDGLGEGSRSDGGATPAAVDRILAAALAAGVGVDTCSPAQPPPPGGSAGAADGGNDTAAAAAEQQQQRQQRDGFFDVTNLPEAAPPIPLGDSPFAFARPVSAGAEAGAGRKGRRRARAGCGAESQARVRQGQLMSSLPPPPPSPPS